MADPIKLTAEELKSYAEKVANSKPDWHEFHTESLPEHAAFTEAFVTPSAAANVAGIQIGTQYEGGGLQFKRPEAFDNVMGELQAEAKRAAEKGARALTVAEKEAFALRAKAAHTVLDEATHTISGSKAVLDNFVNTNHAFIADAVGAGHLSPEQAAQARESLGKYVEDVKKGHTVATQSITDIRADVSKAVPDVVAKTPAYTPSAGSAAISSSAGHVIGEKGYIGAAKYAEIEGSMIKRELQHVKSNFQSGIPGKLKTGLGVIGVLDGARRVGQGLSGMMSSDPEKQEQAGLGSIVVGLSEIGLSGMIARSNGRSVALGA